MIKVNKDAFNTLTDSEILTIKLALEERHKKLSESMKEQNMTEEHDMYEVYINGLIDINRILDKLFPLEDI